jgi:hypothetical protein
MNTSASVFDWLPAELAPVALRLARADELEYQLGWHCLKWSTHALKMKQVRRADGLLDVVVTNVRPIPPVVSMLFSEAINHLRAAIDNVMFYVVESLSGAPLPEDAAVRVAMPIYQSATKLVEWSNRNKGKVPEFDTNTDLFGRIGALQPYNSLAAVTAISTDFEYFAGTLDLHGVHPLLLLRGYSNADKHRAIRVASGRTMPHRTNQIPGRYDITMQPVEPGFVIAEGSRRPSRRGGRDDRGARTTARWASLGSPWGRAQPDPRVRVLSSHPNVGGCPAAARVSM